MLPKVAKARTYSVAVAYVYAKITSPMKTMHENNQRNMIVMRKYAAFKGSFTLVTFVSKTVSNSNTRQSAWAM
jgi:hypothetical protein